MAHAGHNSSNMSEAGPHRTPTVKNSGPNKYCELRADRRPPSAGHTSANERSRRRAAHLHRRVVDQYGPAPHTRQSHTTGTRLFIVPPCARQQSKKLRRGTIAVPVPGPCKPSTSDDLGLETELTICMCHGLVATRLARNLQAESLHRRPLALDASRRGPPM